MKCDAPWANGTTGLVSGDSGSSQTARGPTDPVPDAGGDHPRLLDTTKSKTPKLLANLKQALAGCGWDPAPDEARGRALS